jgi:hypothetical protein
VISLDVGQDLLVVFGAEQKDDPLSGLFNRGNWPVKLVETSEVAQEVARELREIDTTNRQGAHRARSVYGRRLGGWVDDGGHEKPSKKSTADFAEVQLALPLSAGNASEDSGVKETLAFFIDAFYQD